MLLYLGRESMSSPMVVFFTKRFKPVGSFYLLLLLLLLLLLSLLLAVPTASGHCQARDQTRAKAVTMPVGSF